jgi:hypothetical protein
MPRSLGRCMHTSFACRLTYCLASVVIMIRMIVTPVPISSLLLLFQLGKRPIRSVFLFEILSIDTVFVVIPIVVILVVAVEDPVTVIVVTSVFFLASIVLRLGRSTHCRWSCKSCGEKKGTEKISITTVHVVFLLAQEFHLGILGPHRVAFVIAQKMFNTVHLPKSLELPFAHGKTPDKNLEEALRSGDRRRRLLTACLSLRTGPNPLRKAEFLSYRHLSDNWQLLR